MASTMLMFNKMLQLILNTSITLRIALSLSGAVILMLEERR